MARKITQEAINAFMSARSFNKDNTSVSIDVFGTASMFLHGNKIAARYTDGKIEVSNGGWSSNTTKERLNGIPGVSVCQRKGVWYLNGEAWNGEWKKI